MGRARGMDGYFRGPGPGMRRQSDFHRELHRQGSPRCGWVKKGELAEGIGRSRGGRTSKVHAAVDARGRPLRLTITGGQVHDSQMMDSFLNWTPSATRDCRRQSLWQRKDQASDRR